MNYPVNIFYILYVYVVPLLDGDLWDSEPVHNKA